VREIAHTLTALKKLGVTVLIVEQNLGLALDVADRFLILRDGVVIDGGAVAELSGSYDEVVRAIYL
jgi:branched-chain amino acid transport system ATP-binding protein